MKITTRMTYTTLMALPDSEEKFLTLERKLMKLQHHGMDFYLAKKEWRRMFPIYRKEGEKA